MGETSNTLLKIDSELNTPRKPVVSGCMRSNTLTDVLLQCVSEHDFCQDICLLKFQR